MKVIFMENAQEEIWTDYPGYEPGISVKTWLDLLSDQSVFTAERIDVIKKIKECGGIVSCKQLEISFGKPANYYNTHAWILAKSVFEKTGCKVHLSEKGKAQWWPILFWGRTAKRNELGTFMWKLRDELSEALDIVATRESLLNMDTVSEISQIQLFNLENPDILKEIAKRRVNLHPATKDVTATQYYRDKYISGYVKHLAKGHCQLCGGIAPFLDKDGEPYLECHHIKWLSEGGEDSIENAVALCPNCHKKMHILNDSEDKAYLQEVAKKREK